jgi:hypothetical protein
MALENRCTSSNGIRFVLELFVLFSSAEKAVKGSIKLNAYTPAKVRGSILLITIAISSDARPQNQPLLFCFY